MLPCRSIASIRPSGEAVTDIDVPSVTVTSTDPAGRPNTNPTPTRRRSVRISAMPVSPHSHAVNGGTEERWNGFPNPWTLNPTSCWAVTEHGGAVERVNQDSSSDVAGLAASFRSPRHPVRASPSRCHREKNPPLSSRGATHPTAIPRSKPPHCHPEERSDEGPRSWAELPRFARDDRNA